jgi:tetrapyrrole methylase family protein / MazG family protein
LDALDAGDMEALCEELGDLLLHVVMHTQIASEAGDFNAAQVVAGIEAKIRRRHPHVFDNVEVDGVGQVLENWDSIKQTEHDDAYNQSAMNGVPVALPALAQASKIAHRAVKVGFDWQDVKGVVAKVREEMDELLAAGSLEEQEAELGDLLFTLVNWGRWLNLDAENALRLANKRFMQRFRELERLLESRGRQLHELEREEIAALWLESKSSSR